MNQIETKVRGARRRLFVARFAALLSRCLSVGWLAASIAIIAKSIWVLPWDSQTWMAYWVASTTGIAIAVAFLWAWWTRPSLVVVATEVDQRFQMKQRLGSVLAMRDVDRDTPMGKALVEDASSRAEKIQLSERFPLAPTRLGWLPLLPAALIAIATFFGPAIASKASAKPSAELIAQAEQIKKSTEALKKKIQDQRKKAEAAGLKDAADMFSKIESDMEKMSTREAINPKEAMIAVNDLKKQLEERRKQLGSPDAMRQALSKMSENEKGPVESIVKAMKDGEFAEGKEQAKALAEKIRNGQLTPAEKEALKKQVEAVRDQLKQAAEKHEAEKQQLQQQIEEAKREGRSEDAAKAQEKLNELEAKDGQMQGLQKLAESMNAAAEAMSKGDSAEAAEAMEAMADQLGEMQDEMEQLQDIQETLDTLSQSKEQMRCKKCGGQGCQDCKGDGQGQSNDPTENGGRGGSKYGLGKGSGLSGPEDEESETQSYESQVRGEPKQGRGVNAGFADGPNRKGVSREDVKQAVLGAISEDSDPTENQTLPQAEREHAREYFDKLRSGK
jgi:chemotaxis protein histidine kinase CheA